MSIFAKRFNPLVGLIGISLLNHVAYNGTRFAAILLALFLTNGSPKVSGLVIASLSIVPMLTSVHLGRWVDKHNKDSPIILGSAGILIGVAIIATFQHVIAIGIALVIIGSGYNFYQIAVQQLIGHATKSTAARTHMFNLFSMAISTSLVVSPVIAGYVLEWTNFQITFVCLLVFPLFTTGLMILTRSKLRAIPGALVKEPVFKHEHPTKKESMFDLFAHKPLLRVLLVSAALSSAWDLHTFVIPLIGVERSLTNPEIGWIVSFFSIGTLSIRVLMPIIVKWFKPWTIIHAALLTATLVFVMYPWLPSQLWMMIFSFILGLGLGSCQPNILAQIHEVSPTGRGAEAIGIRAMLSYATGVFLPIGFGALTEYTGLLVPFMIIAMILALALWFSKHHDRQYLDRG